MTSIGIILVALAGGVFIWAVVAFARMSRHPNYDVMGASMVFTFFWLFGVSLLSLGLVRLSLIAPRTGFWVLAGGFVVGKVVEGFLIEPVLRRLFKGYRRRP